MKNYRATGDRVHCWKENEKMKMKSCHCFLLSTHWETSESKWLHVTCTYVHVPVPEPRRPGFQPLTPLIKRPNQQVGCPIVASPLHGQPRRPQRTFVLFAFCFFCSFFRHRWKLTWTHEHMLRTLDIQCTQRPLIFGQKTSFIVYYGYFSYCLP
jgi:hypothetical protein